MCRWPSTAASSVARRGGHPGHGAVEAAVPAAGGEAGEHGVQDGGVRRRRARAASRSLPVHARVVLVISTSSQRVLRQDSSVALGRTRRSSVLIAHLGVVAAQSDSRARQGTLRRDEPAAWRHGCDATRPPGVGRPVGRDGWPSPMGGAAAVRQCSRHREDHTETRSTTMTETTITETVRNGVDTATMFATLDAIKAQPEIAQFRFRARNRWLGGAHNRSTIKDFYAACGEDTTRTEAFTLDAGEPAILLGTDTGPNPAEFLLHALAACVTTSLVFSAAARRVRLTIGRVDARGRPQRRRARWAPTPTTSATASSEIRMTHPHRRRRPRREAARGRAARHRPLGRLRLDHEAASRSPSTSTPSDGPTRVAGPRPGHPREDQADGTRVRRRGRRRPVRRVRDRDADGPGRAAGAAARPRRTPPGTRSPRTP